MKKIISIFALFFPFSAFSATPVQSYKLTVEFRDRGEHALCPGFRGWQEEVYSESGLTECVFRFLSVVTPAQNIKLDFTGVYGYASADGQIDIQYYVGDIDAGVRFQFKIPQNKEGFVFGQEPYKFNLHAGDYASGVWDMRGTVVIEKP